MTKVKTQTTAGKMLQNGVMDKLQKAKQLQAKVSFLIKSCWPQPDMSQYPKQKTARRQISSWAEI